LFLQSNDDTPTHGEEDTARQNAAVVADGYDQPHGHGGEMAKSTSPHEVCDYKFAKNAAALTYHAAGGRRETVM
jgi:hypothetical protein